MARTSKGDEAWCLEQLDSSPSSVTSPQSCDYAPGDSTPPDSHTSDLAQIQSSSLAPLRDINNRHEARRSNFDSDPFISRASSKALPRRPSRKLLYAATALSLLALVSTAASATLATVPTPHLPRDQVLVWLACSILALVVFAVLAFSLYRCSRSRGRRQGVRPRTRQNRFRLQRLSQDLTDSLAVPTLSTDYSAAGALVEAPTRVSLRTLSGVAQAQRPRSCGSMERWDGLCEAPLEAPRLDSSFWLALQDDGEEVVGNDIKAGAAQDLRRSGEVEYKNRFTFSKPQPPSASCLRPEDSSGDGGPFGHASHASGDPDG